MAASKAKAGAPKPAQAKRAASAPKKTAGTAKRAASAPAKTVETAQRVAKAQQKQAELTSRTVSRASTVAADAAAETVQTVSQGNIEMTNETIKKVQANQAAAAAADRIQAVFGDVNERARTAVERSTKVIEEMTELTKGNVEAIVASSKVAAKGVETLGQEAAEYSRRSFEEASAALKSFAEVKSATDFFRLQGDFARSAFDSLVAETSKMSEQMLKIAGEAAEPITSRYSVAAERVKNVAAF